MDTQNAVAVEATDPKQKSPRTHTIRLVGAGKSGKEALVLSVEAKDGSWTTRAYVYNEPPVKGKDRTGQPGGTVKSKTEADADRDAEAIASAFVKAGWVRPERKGGFVAKPDAFSLTNIPSPRK